MQKKEETGMNFRRFAGLALAVLAAGSMTACGGGSQAQKAEAPAGQASEDSGKGGSEGKGGAAAGEAQVILTLAEVNPADSLDGQVESYFKEQVESLSGGTVLIDIQASGVMGAENDVLDGMTTNGGTVDMARISSFALTNY